MFAIPVGQDEAQIAFGSRTVLRRMRCDIRERDRCDQLPEDIFLVRVFVLYRIPLISEYSVRLLIIQQPALHGIA